MAAKPNQHNVSAEMTERTQSQLFAAQPLASYPRRHWHRGRLRVVADHMQPRMQPETARQTVACDPAASSPLVTEAEAGGFEPPEPLGSLDFKLWAHTSIRV